MVLSLELVLLSFFFFMFGIYLYMKGEIFYLEWDLLSVSSIDYCYIIYLDYYGVLFISIILFVSCMICFYSFWYVDMYKIRFYYLMVVFIFSMFILVMSPNLMSMLLGWDGLGFVSFCLVLFYYNSISSLDNSLITLFYNRLGDGFLLVVIGFIMSAYSSCGGGVWDLSVGINFILLLGLCTKSAQFPFMSWLPKAMAAPTPVSSLVHSSTLVTAGVYMMIRFFDNVNNSLLFMNISMLTMFFSGILALLDNDIKKIIAYSTLSQLGLMVFGLCVGMKDFVYFHMLSHAIFKSMMFMSSGVIIHELAGLQDVRYYGGCIEIFPFSSMCLLMGSFSLCGFYFLSGFYSKDVMIEMYMSGMFGVILFVLFYFSMILTILYSVRLMDYLNSDLCTPCYLNCMEGVMSYSMTLLYFFTMVYGAIISSLVIWFNMFYYSIYYIKFYLLIINIFIIIYFSDIFFYQLIWLNLDFHKILKNNNLFFVSLDSYWVEMYGGWKVISNFNYLLYWLKDYSIYFMFMVIFFIYFIL
uniref:NADH:ubiquinone reductase (H(+)-translocating) n=1 Tax=Wallacidia oculata TaxID=590134 RepID=E0WBP0_9HYME|nr:NADH dehydrogenase subunit 5 [Wallacidia oculata]